MLSKDGKRTSEQLVLLAGYRYALSLVHHEQDAEDLVQHACLKVFRAKGELSSKHYFLKTIRNLFYDRCRQQRTKQSTPLSEGCLQDHSPSHLRSVDGKLDMETVLATLGHEQREVLYLNCVEGFSAEEISRMTGVPKGTILSQLSRAKKKVRGNHEYELYPESTL